MNISAVKARKDLSADSLFRWVRSRFDRIADHRTGLVDIPLGDALMSAFAMFSLKDSALLAFDERRDDPNDNFRTIFGIDHVPCDSQMRAILDPVLPEHVRPIYQDVFRRLQRGKALESFVYLDGYYLLSLDGTGYFSSSKVHGPSCLEKHHRGGGITYSHQLLGATLVHPDRKEVTLEDRERDLQYPQESRIPPGAQLRPRRTEPVGGAGVTDDAGLPCGPDAATVLSAVPGRLEEAAIQ